VGRALKGPMGGRELRRWPSTLTTWGRWRQLHPQTTVNVDPGVSGFRRFTEETWSWIITLDNEGPIVNEEFVRRGWALVVPPARARYAAAEKKAQTARLGIWSGSFVAPWEWRRTHGTGTAVE